MKNLSALTIVCLALCTVQLSAQNVSTRLILGTNLTKATLTESGKSQVGFRMGLNTGAGVSIKVDERLELGLELLYSQNGLYVQFAQIPAVALDKITLHYFEVPIYLSYPLNINQNENKKGYEQSFSGGISYARLFDYKIIGVDDTDLTNDFRFEQNSALLFNFSATSSFSESFSLDGRVTFAAFGELTFALRMLYTI